MPGSKRISVRLEPDLAERLVRYCQENGEDISVPVRQALEGFLPNPQTSAQPATPSRPNLAPPGRIMALVSHYGAYGDGDLRKHRNALYCDLLAASFTTKQLYPRTPGMVEGYNELRQLAKFFGLND